MHMLIFLLLHYLHYLTLLFFAYLTIFNVLFVKCYNWMLYDVCLLFSCLYFVVCCSILTAFGIINIIIIIIRGRGVSLFDGPAPGLLFYIFRPASWAKNTLDAWPCNLKNLNIENWSRRLQSTHVLNFVWNKQFFKVQYYSLSFTILCQLTVIF